MKRYRLSIAGEDAEQLVLFGRVHAIPDIAYPQVEGSLYSYTVPEKTLRLFRQLVKETGCTIHTEEEIRKSG